MASPNPLLRLANPLPYTCDILANPLPTPCEPLLETWNLELKNNLFQVPKVPSSKNWNLEPGTWNLRIICSKFQKFQAPKIGTLEPET